MPQTHARLIAEDALICGLRRLTGIRALHTFSQNDFTLITATILAPMVEENVIHADWPYTGFVPTRPH